MKKQLNIEIGRRVKAARVLLGLSREELAEALGISSLFLGYLECGQKGMSLETLCALCRTLHVSADYLILGKELPEHTDAGKAEKLLGQFDRECMPYVEETLQAMLKLMTAASVRDEQKKEGENHAQMG
jgi:transcriptional regulator with XRE-family HTH domain